MTLDGSLMALARSSQVGTLTNDFFVHLTDTALEWKPSTAAPGTYEGCERTSGAVKYTALIPLMASDGLRWPQTATDGHRWPPMPRGRPRMLAPRPQLPSTATFAADRARRVERLYAQVDGLARRPRLWLQLRAARHCRVLRVRRRQERLCR